MLLCYTILQDRQPSTVDLDLATVFVDIVEQCFGMKRSLDCQLSHEGQSITVVAFKEGSNFLQSGNTLLLYNNYFRMPTSLKI